MELPNALWEIYTSQSILRSKYSLYADMIHSFHPKRTDNEEILKEIKIYIHKNHLLKWKGCLEYALVFKAICDEIWINTWICYPNGISHYFHAAIVFENHDWSLDTFKVTGRDYTFDYVILSKEAILKRLKWMNPAITLVNQVKWRLWIICYHQDKIPK